VQNTEHGGQRGAVTNVLQNTARQWCGCRRASRSCVPTADNLHVPRRSSPPRRQRSACRESCSKPTGKEGGHDSRSSTSMARPNANGGRTYARARKGRYDQLTIFLLQECQLRGTHFDNCAECKNLRGRQDNDTYAVLADCKCTPPSTHPTEEVAANRGAHATTQCSHAIAYRPAVQSVPRALGCV
jgi:hypothetical protein